MTYKAGSCWRCKRVRPLARDPLFPDDPFPSLCGPCWQIRDSIASVYRAFGRTLAIIVPDDDTV